MLSFGDCSGASFVIFPSTSLPCGMPVSHMDLELIAVKWATLSGVLLKGARNCDDAQSVASKASNRVVRSSRVWSDAISVSILLWWVGFLIPAINCDRIISGA